MGDLLNSKVRALSLVDAITERIETAIFNGDLAPGTRLSEQGLATSLGVSRGPLREAVRRLEGRKLLERTPNIGVKVAEISLNALLELLYIREALEGMACALAAENMSDAEIQELQKLLDDHAKQKGVKLGTGYLQGPKDFDFHFRIIKGSHNQRLVNMLCDDLYDLLRVYRFKASTKPGRTLKAFEEHQAIVRALQTRDPKLAEDLMRAHIRTARIAIEEQMTADTKAQVAVG